MLPKKVKDLIPDFCRICGYDNVEDIEYIILEAYKELKAQQVGMEWDEIVMTGLGEFFMKIWTVERELKKMSAFLTIERMSESQKKRTEENRDKMLHIKNRQNGWFKSLMDNVAETRKQHVEELKELHSTPHKEGLPFGKKGYFRGCKCDICREEYKIYKKEYHANLKLKKLNKYKEQKIIDNDTTGEIHEGLG